MKRTLSDRRFLGQYLAAFHQKRRTGAKSPAPRIKQTSREDQEAIDLSAQYDNKPLVLSEQDSRIFLETMENPPEPSEALIDLFR